MKIKICGLMREYDVQLCGDLGIDILGFVVEYPRDVPWNLTREQAKKLISTTRHSTGCPTCIVTGGTPEIVISLARELKPDMVQLHYRETVAETVEIADELKKSGIKTIRAVDRETEIKELCATDIYAILVDSRTPANAAENNLAIDVDLFNGIKKISTKPLVIAGGITPENVSDVIACTGADWIDVMTGIEQLPGIKDKTKIEALIKRTRDGTKEG